MPQAGPATWWDNRNAAAFCLLKKYAPHFFNPASGGTRQKEAAYPVTGKNQAPDGVRGVAFYRPGTCLTYLYA
ncbi:MAG: hypothetical protein BGP14_18700 [Sphingobacteriales bacterium 44-15]|nr:MAG: hypothetical protein BGP14_18700 [Sphingobacteriales bacterium 44-15]